MKALIRASTLAESVGIVGMYWKDGNRKADAGGIVSDVGSCSLLPDLVVGMDRLVDVGAVGDSS